MAILPAHRHARRGGDQRTDQRERRTNGDIDARMIRRGAKDRPRFGNGIRLTVHLPVADHIFAPRHFPPLQLFEPCPRP